MPKLKGVESRKSHTKMRRKRLSTTSSSPIKGKAKLANKGKKSIRSASPRSDSSEDSVFANQVCAPRSSGRLKKMAAMFNREVSFDDNRSDIYEDDEDRGFFQMNESDEGIGTFPDEIDHRSVLQMKIHALFLFFISRMYQEKLQDFKQQLQNLNGGKHPEYMKRLNKLDVLRSERLLIAEICKKYEIELIEKEYVREQKAAQEEYEQKKVELKKTLLNDLQEKKKVIESERISMELTGDSVEVKPAVTRKLRRRPNDPLPAPEKRRKTSPQINYMLDEKEILEDLKALNKLVSLPGEVPSSQSRSENKTGNSRIKTSGNGSHSEISYPLEVRSEDGKLLYDKKWFHKGCSVVVETRENGRYSGSLHSIGQSEIWIKKTDNTKVRVYISSLVKGKFHLKKKSTNGTNSASVSSSPSSTHSCNT
ncbi:PREDICTED: sin3 histone deacetylase corepressor complex component SDS3-like [Acropora digitifera]|uniref:sin3 histone deacetylase corepressor complex component SDS3-like n=1 Tax=Acropora digitifera TaxID=70779 RepID=UPI00077AB7EB|nr:PREDICTED: sin3 histone deacetylase corepressor complex component SDS3-like [Acropora digitifera]